ncbi:MAG TPA: phosphatase PAP2 family protein [Nocardioidaceae bacterium]
MERDLHWVGWLWLVVVGFAAVALWRSAVLDIPFRDPGGRWLTGKLLATVEAFAVLVVIDAIWRSPRGARRPRNVAHTLRQRWPWRRLLLVASGLLAYHAVYFCYRQLKSWDVFNANQDELLDRADRWLFGGHSPAVLLQDLLGRHDATYVLLVIYESFTWVVLVSFVASVVFVDRLRDGFVCLASLIWVWILGVASYYLIPSLGPFHVRPQDFADLPRTLVTEHQELYMDQRAYLLAHPEAADAYAQVSAFASLHVAVLSVIVLMAWYYGLRRVAVALAVYLLATMVATVYLGWHFVLDDIAGVLIAVAAVALGRLTIYPRGWQAPPGLPIEAQSGRVTT